MIGIIVVTIIVVIIALLLLYLLLYKLLLLYIYNSNKHSLKGRTALVTGVGLNNIGGAFARILPDYGVSNIICIYYGNDNIHVLLEDLRNNFPNLVITGIHLDLCDELEVQTKLGHLQNIDVIIINHVICSHFYPSTDIPMEVIRKHMEVNFLSVVRLINLFHTQFQRLIVMSSMAAVVPNPNRAAYVSSKAALSGWMSWYVECQKV